MRKPLAVAAVALFSLAAAADSPKSPPGAKPGPTGIVMPQSPLVGRVTANVSIEAVEGTLYPVFLGSCAAFTLTLQVTGVPSPIRVDGTGDIQSRLCVLSTTVRPGAAISGKVEAQRPGRGLNPAVVVGNLDLKDGVPAGGTRTYFFKTTWPTAPSGQVLVTIQYESNNPDACSKYNVRVTPSNGKERNVVPDQKQTSCFAIFQAVPLGPAKVNLFLANGTAPLAPEQIANVTEAVAAQVTLVRPPTAILGVRLRPPGYPAPAVPPLPCADYKMVVLQNGSPFSSGWALSFFTSDCHASFGKVPAGVPIVVEIRKGAQVVASWPQTLQPKSSQELIASNFVFAP